MAISEDARSVPLVGLPLAVVITTGVFLVFACVGVSTRTAVAYQRKVFGLDDGLVIFSATSFVVVFGLTVKGAIVGIGTKNSGLNSWLTSESEMYYTIWILTYLSGMVMLKTSVCVTLLRILAPTQQKMRASVYGLMALSWAAWCVAFFGVLLLCRPIEANWNKDLVAEGKAVCGSTSVLVGISQTVTACSIVTDTGCTVLPGIMLWRTNMGKTSSLEVFGLLSVASIASVATIARAPYLSHYDDPTNNLLYYCGYMVVFSNVETGIGCFATSLPAIRRLYLALFNGSIGSGGAAAAHIHNNDGIVTIGGSGGAKGGKPKLLTMGSVFTNPTDRGETNVHIESGHGEWERLTDASSDKGVVVPGADGGGGGLTTQGIRADYTYTVEMHRMDSSKPQ